MNLNDSILINKFGQGLIESGSMIDQFSAMNLYQKRSYLRELVFLIQQSMVSDADVEPAIKESKLKQTYTPCIILKKSTATYNLLKITELPEEELVKVYVLFLSLFKIGYSRRFESEKNNVDKWWYWDLSDDGIVESIKNKYH